MLLGLIKNATGPILHTYIAPGLAGAVIHGARRATPRHSSPVRPLRETDRAIRAMSDLTVAVTEDQGLEQVREQMSRMGVSALPVIRDRLVIGVVTEPAVRAASRRRTVRTSGGDVSSQQPAARVADIMIPVEQVDAVDWESVENVQIRDLVKMLRERGCKLLLVVLHVTSTSSIVRGLIHRDRIEQQLGAPCLARRPFWMHQRHED